MRLRRSWLDEYGAELLGDRLEDAVDAFYAFRRSIAWILMAARAVDSPEERREKRRRQKVYLARYAYQNVLQWADVETVELDRLHYDTVKLVGEEGAAVRAAAGGH